MRYNKLKSCKYYKGVDFLRTATIKNIINIMFDYILVNDVICLFISLSTKTAVVDNEFHARYLYI